MESNISLNCNICQKDFKEKRKLDRHIRNHGEKVLECDICPFKTRNHYYLKLHKKNHLKTPDTNRKLLPCETCGKNFVSSSTLKTHMKLHNEIQEKVFCKICKKDVSKKNFNMLVGTM